MSAKVEPGRGEFALDTFLSPRELAPNDTVLNVFDPAKNAVAMITVVSVDGVEKHRARARLVHAAPAAVRVVLALRDLFDLGLEFDCPRGPEAKAKVDQCFKDLDAALAALEGRS